MHSSCSAASSTASDCPSWKCIVENMQHSHLGKCSLLNSQETLQQHRGSNNQHGKVGRKPFTTALFVHFERVETDVYANTMLSVRTNERTGMNPTIFSAQRNIRRQQQFGPEVLCYDVNLCRHQRSWM